MSTVHLLSSPQLNLSGSISTDILRGVSPKGTLNPVRLTVKSNHHKEVPRLSLMMTNGQLSSFSPHGTINKTLVSFSE